MSVDSAIAAWRPLFKMGFLGYQESSAYNYARALKGRCKEGLITEKEMAEKWEKYRTATAPGERNEIWNEDCDRYGDIMQYAEGSPI